MRRTKKATQKRTRIEPGYQNAASNKLKAASRSVGEYREIADEMNEYSMRSLENVFRAWQQFLDARALRQVVELQTRYAQNAYEAYVAEISRLGDLYLSLTRLASKPLGQVSRRS